MAMSKDVLGPAIANLIMDQSAPAEMKTKITQQWTDIAGAIIDHIKTATITVAPGIVVSVDPNTGAGATTGNGTATIS